MWVSGPQHDKPQPPLDVDRVLTRHAEGKKRRRKTRSLVLEGPSRLQRLRLFLICYPDRRWNHQPPSPEPGPGLPPILSPSVQDTRGKASPAERLNEKERHGCPRKNHHDLETHEVQLSSGFVLMEEKHQRTPSAVPYPHPTSGFIRARGETEEGVTGKNQSCRRGGGGGAAKKKKKEKKEGAANNAEEK